MSRHSAAEAAIRAAARDLEIDGIGICGAQAMEEARRGFDISLKKGFIPSAAAPSPKTLARLTRPASHLKSARSVVCAYQSYYTGEADPSDPTVGVIAPYTRFNYYEDLRLRLERLAGFMRAKYACRTKVFSCYVSLAEKPLAREAGLGFYGKNGVIITPRHGSLVVLGEIITDLELHPDRELAHSCGDCTLCMEACPTGAIVVPYLVKRDICIQYLSERRGTIPLHVRDLWKNRLYGCSTCQDVCPHNRDLTATSHAVRHGAVGASVALGEMLQISPDRFQARFGDNQIGMRDPSAIRRNALIATGNSCSPDFLGPLRACAAETDPMIRQHSLWAIWKTCGPASRSGLEKALRTEPVPYIRAEIKTLLDGIGPVA